MTLVFPTTMMTFFHKSEGMWFTQRSVHHFDLVADQSGESNLSVTVLAKNDERIMAICKDQGINPAIATGGASFTWQDNKDLTEPSPDRAAILVDIPDDETGRSGKLLRNQGYVEQIPVVSHYQFGPDGVLTIDTDYDKQQGQERCWFVTDDFRVRVSTVRMVNGIFLMTYCSERRCVLPDTLTAMVERNRQRAMV
ncbi:MAG: phycobiliprotein lyase [Leptolyngbyaceae bacterium]|nr:phycobiliprotein lyase [Leptolyngbyaceae bacterium]